MTGSIPPRQPATPGLLADEFFLTGLDDVTGEQRLEPRALGVGLGASLLGELVLGGKLVIDDGRLRAFDDVCEDELQDRVRQWVRKDRSVVLARDWIRVLAARDIADLVRHRLHASNKVVRTTRRRLLRKPLELYAPPSLSTAAASGVRIAGNLNVPRDLNPTDLLLAGLLRATGRDRYVLSHCDPSVHDELAQQLQRNLGSDASQLLAHTTDVLVTETLTPF